MMRTQVRRVRARHDVMPYRCETVRSRLLLVASLASLVSCGPSTSGLDAAVQPLPGTYANVTAIFNHSCTFSSCHGGAGAGSSHLNLHTSIVAGTLVADLERPACQYGPMPLLTPGDPSHSWLYLKVAGPHMGTQIDFTPAADWDHDGLMPNGSGVYPVSTCPLTAHGAITFGEVMPMGSDTITNIGLRADQIETVRLWIEAGAPGPGSSPEP